MKRKIKKLQIEAYWWLYKLFGIQRKYPCGRTKKNKYLCCMQPFIGERMYLSENKTECYCKVCNSIRELSTHEIDLNNPGGW